MNEFEGIILDCNEDDSSSTSNEIEVLLDGIKNVQIATFKTLTTAQIEEMMKQVIDDVKSIVSVSFSSFSFSSQKN